MPAQELRHNAQQVHVAALVAVHRLHRQVEHAGVQRAQAEQHVGFEEVARRDLARRQRAGHAGCDGGVAVGGVEHVPVAGRKLGEERERRVPHQAGSRHGAHVLDIVEAIALHVVGAALGDGGNEVRDQRRVHLPVAIQLQDHLRPRRQRLLVAGEHRAAHALVGLVLHHRHTWVRAFRQHQRACRFGAGIVDHPDLRHLRPDAGQHAQYVPPHAEARDHHGHHGGEGVPHHGHRASSPSGPRQSSRASVMAQTRLKSTTGTRAGNQRSPTCAK